LAGERKTRIKGADGQLEHPEADTLSPASTRLGRGVCIAAVGATCGAAFSVGVGALDRPVRRAPSGRASAALQERKMLWELTWIKDDVDKEVSLTALESNTHSNTASPN